MKKTAIVLTISIMVSCKKAYQNLIPVPESFRLPWGILDENRMVNLWLPPDNTASIQTVPVLFMPAGGIHEVFSHRTNTWAELVEAQKNPPVILAGIENSQHPSDLTGSYQTTENESVAPLTDGTSLFRAFIKQELWYKITQRYRTTSQFSKTVLFKRLVNKISPFYPVFRISMFIFTH